MTAHPIPPQLPADLELDAAEAEMARVDALPVNMATAALVSAAALRLKVARERHAAALAR